MLLSPREERKFRLVRPIPLPRRVAWMSAASWLRAEVEKQGRKPWRVESQWSVRDAGGWSGAQRQRRSLVLTWPWRMPPFPPPAPLMGIAACTDSFWQARASYPFSPRIGVGRGCWVDLRRAARFPGCVVVRSGARKGACSEVILWCFRKGGGSDSWMRGSAVVSDPWIEGSNRRKWRRRVGPLPRGGTLGGDAGSRSLVMARVRLSGV